MKTMKSFLAGMVAVASVMAIAPMSAFADTEIKQDSTNKTGGMVVSYLKSAVSPTFTITIPATANLNAETPTATIKAEDVYLDTTKHKQINVTLDSAQYVNKGDSTFIAKTADGNSQVTYTIGKGTATTGVKVGDTVAEFTADDSVTLNFSAPTGATYAGTHTETLTFGISVESAETIVDLSKLTGNYEAKNGETLTGTLAANVKISIADGATVTLKDANITNLGNGCNWAGINCPGNATIMLKGTNTVCAGKDNDGYKNYSCIWIAPSKTLTIDGDGSLTAYSDGDAEYYWGAGIGGGFQVDCGNIVINGGTITATGGTAAAGIGSGEDSSCGNITINGGTINATNATDGSSAAGIGSGTNENSDTSCGDITINGGTVNATGGKGSAGIGSGVRGSDNETSCGNITIANTVTKVTATKGASGTGAYYSIGAGAGGSTCGTVTIGDNVGAISESPYTYEP